MMQGTAAAAVNNIAVLRRKLKQGAAAQRIAAKLGK
jgi:hypothetical protein